MKQLEFEFMLELRTLEEILMHAINEDSRKEADEYLLKIMLEYSNKYST